MTARANAPHTRIMCTLAPPVPGGARPQDGPGYVSGLVAAGMDAARINLSHATAWIDFTSGRPPLYLREEALFRGVRDAAAAAGPERHVATLVDLQGVKVRLRLPDARRAEGLRIEAGDVLRMRITTQRAPDELTCDGSPRLVEAVREALAERDEIEVAIGDGEPILRCTGLEGDVVTLRAPDDGVLMEGRGVTFRGVPLREEPPLTARDRVDLAAFVVPGLLAGDIDFVALSFAQSGAAVRRLREFCAAAVAWFRHGEAPADAEDASILARVAAARPDLRERYAGDGALDVPVVAKIETAGAVREIDGILQESDAVMVARGDLGLHCAPEDVPRHQKDILRRARLQGRAAIVATQMLQSMESSPEPRRAEASDVFNAVLGAADALLLTNETSTGARPAETVTTLARIARAAARWEAEPEPLRYSAFRAAFVELETMRREAWTQNRWLKVTDRMTREAVRMAEAIGARAIVAATRSGQTARHIARFDPGIPLVAIVPDAAVARRLALTGSVRALVAPAPTAAQALQRGISRAVAIGLVRPGDLVVVAGARPDDPPGATTLLDVRSVSG